MFRQLLAYTKKFPPAPLLGGGGSKRAKNAILGPFRPIFPENVTSQIFCCCDFWILQAQISLAQLFKPQQENVA